MKGYGLSSMCTPPTTAIEVRPLRIAWTASWSATSDDEQAVSTAMLGPFRSKA